MPTHSTDISIWQALKQSIAQVLPDINEDLIQPANSLRALGANSIDRAEIIVLTLQALRLKMPLTAFAQAKNMGELAQLLSTETAKFS